MSRILVVDDDKITLELEKRILCEAGYDVLAVSQALTALDMLKLYNFDLIIADVEMPQFDGFQFVSTIRTNPSLHNISIAFLSCHSEEEIVSKAAKLGADFYLIKPISRKNYLSKIETFLENRPLKEHLKFAPEKPVPVEIKAHVNVRLLEVSEFGVKILTTEDIQEDQIIELPSTIFQGQLPDNIPFKVISVMPYEGAYKKVSLVFENHRSDIVKKMRKYIQNMSRQKHPAGAA